ncbi:hypothetical protein HDV06_003129 [Boothiomyces sp. JEL0866]|nr:hypothetical protein HDV06_003112 [Boothiomyces sp. JEL0866]KAJ3322409.1 hypothetical protein HDV06_003129 [Boothiomyces sp. JEL0866]
MQTDREYKVEPTEIIKSKKKQPRQTLNEQQKQKLLEMEKAIQEHQQSGKSFVVESGINFTDINNELYTPKSIINAAKSVVSGNVFHLDPCSTTYANNIHEGKLALHFFDEYQNGLVQHWHGNVWLSPPTSSANLWFMAAETKFITGEISSCFCLLKSDFCEDWFQQALKYPHCILKERLSFYTPTGREKLFADSSYTVVYMGGNNNLFGQVFSKLGSIPGYNSWAFQDKSALENFVLQQIPNIEQISISESGGYNTEYL